MNSDSEPPRSPMRASWRGRWHAQNWLRSLERYAFPRIGSRPVSEVNSADVLEILTPIWYVKAETARTVRHRIRSVLVWAIAMDLRNDNPCDQVLPVLGPQNDIVQHMQALPHKDVAAAVETVRSGSAQSAVKLAFEFLVLTTARSGEVRRATWAEMDTAGRVWTLSAARMIGDAGPLVFTDRGGMPLDTKQFRRLLERCGIACVPHGFHSSFRDWAEEETDQPREVIEAALAHVVQNKVEAAYARSDLFERRRRLMNDWEAYLTGAHRPQPPIAEQAEHELAGTAAP